MTATLEHDVRLGRRARTAREEQLWRGCAADPLVFLAASRTLDEHAATEALRPFPVCGRCMRDPVANNAYRIVEYGDDVESVCAAHGHVHKPYFAPLTRQWQTEEIVPIEKSRQIMVSWWCVAVHLWLAMTKPGALIAFQSLSREKSCELLNRAEIVYRSLPRELQRFGPMTDAPKATARKIEDEMSFTHLVDDRKIASRIKAIPNGPHHVRMYTLTAIFIDEASVWESDEDLEESYSAALQAIKGGGKLTIVGTVNTARHFLHRLCNGEVA